MASISPDPKPKELPDQYRDALHIKHYSERTEETYLVWVKDYILFHQKRHPSEMGRAWFISPMPWNKNTRTQTVIGYGSTFFPLQNSQKTKRLN